MNLRELLYSDKIARRFQTVDEETVVVPYSYMESKKIKEPAGQQRAIPFHEEFKTGFKSYNAGYIEVFKNPTEKEIEKVVKGEKSLRYFADNRDKSFYVFSSRIVHTPVSNHLNFSVEDVYSGYLLGGYAEKKGEKWITKTLHNMEALKPDDTKAQKRFVRTNWSWIEKYVSAEKAIERLKKRWKREIEKERK